MATEARTLEQIFGTEELSKQRLAALVGGKELEPIRKKMTKELKGLPVPDGFFDLMLGKVRDLLKVDLVAILVNAWVGSETFRSFVDQQTVADDETLLVRLAEHTITSEHTPSLKPSINNVPLGEIKFHLLIDLALKGVVLSIQDGRLIEFTIGSCEGRGSLKCANVTIVDKEFEPVGLTGSVDLGDGIPLGLGGEEVAELLGGSSAAN